MRWWRVFIDRITGRSGNDLAHPTGPRRRKTTRYGFQIELAIKCSSWPHFIDLYTGDVSQSGAFVPTDETAHVGENVDVTLHLPDASEILLTGTVVNVVTGGAPDRQPGLGIHFNALGGDESRRFDEVLAAARSAQPVPDPPPGVTSTGSVSLIAVAEAVALAAEPATPDPPPPAERPAATGPIVGIDLGTTYTSIATVRGKKVTVLSRADGNRSIPSVVAFPSKDEIVVGVEARARIATDPGHTVASPKRLLGRPYDETEIQSFVSRVPYRTFAGPDDTTVIEIWGREYAIPQLCSFLFEDARKLAEEVLGERVRRAVVTVPISFDTARIEALRRAARMAGLDVVAVIDEPSAAALSNRFDPEFGGIVGVYEFGGGTFDFSVVDVTGGDFQVLATAGDTWLGGDDFDQVLAEAAANQFWREHKVDLRKQAVEWQRLLFACEQAKRDLSVQQTTLISVPEVLRTATGMVDLNLSIDRATFKRAASALIQRSLATCGEALSALDMKPRDLRTIYLSGGTTYILQVREAVAAHFKVPIRTGVPPEHAVCLGAAIHAAQLQLRSGATLPTRG